MDKNHFSQSNGEPISDRLPKTYVVYQRRPKILVDSSMGFEAGDRWSCMPAGVCRSRDGWRGRSGRFGMGANKQHSSFAKRAPCRWLVSLRRIEWRGENGLRDRFSSLFVAKPMELTFATPSLRYPFRNASAVTSHPGLSGAFLGATGISPRNLEFQHKRVQLTRRLQHR